MRTIFITSFHSTISRNILQTRFFKKLAADAENRIVVFAPDYKAAFFKKEFGGENVLVEGVNLSVQETGLANLIFRRLARMMLPTNTARIQRRAKFYEDRKIWYFLAVSFFSFLGKFGFFRKLARSLDNFFMPLRFTEQFEKYKPDLVFATDIQNEHDIHLLRQARRGGTAALAMVRSWDNLTSMQGILRVVPDRLFVHSEILKKEAVTRHGIPQNIIAVTGKPHYDNYLKDARTPRGEFFKELGLSAGKKTVFFAPWGKGFEKQTGADAYNLEVLDKISRKYDLNVLVRPNPAHPFSWKPGENKRLVLDRSGVAHSADVVADRDVGKDGDRRLADALYHTDVVVSCSSTIVIDAALFDKPVVVTALMPKETPYYQSVLRYYDYDHFKNVLKTGGARLAKTAKELEETLLIYLQDPAKDEIGRQKIVKEQNGGFNGESSELLADLIFSHIKQ